MLRYLGAALLAGPGALPLNGLLGLAFLVLGLLASPLWFIALALQMLFTFALAAQPRFQNVVKAKRISSTAPSTPEAGREQLAAQLKRETRARYDIWARRGEQILQRQKTTGADSIATENNRAAIGHLLLIYLRLLLARQNLLSEDITSARETLRQERTTLEKELAREDLSETLRQSKTATLQLLEQRAEKTENRREALDEVESDLGRIEAHLALSLEQAVGSARPLTVEGDIGLATQMLDSEYSEAFGVVSDAPVAETTSVATDERTKVQL